MTITYLASQNWVLDSERELAEKFEAETGIHVDYQIIPADQYFSVLQTKLEAGGEGIDIFGGQSGKTDIQLQLGVEENAVPVTDEEWVQRMDPLSTEQISLDGTVYGQTIWDTVGGSWVVVYNKAIFADNGIEVPTTYDEFAAACQTLSDAGVTPIYEPISDGWHHVLWFAELGPAYEAASPDSWTTQRQRDDDGRRSHDGTRARSAERPVLERLLRRQRACRTSSPTPRPTWPAASTP